MLHVQCDGCRSSSYVECGCPTGHDALAAGAHHDTCNLSDLGATVACPPGSGCCTEDHSHDANANACPGIISGHEADCPEPDNCRTWKSAMAHAFHPDYDGEPLEACPGGHCHRDIPECHVCRSVTITVMPGSTTIQPVGG